MPEIKYLNNTRTQELIDEVKRRLNTKITHYSVMPEVTAETTDKIVQYIGATTEDYTEGDFYKADTTELKWIKISYSKEEIDAAISAAGHFMAVAELPTTDIKTNVIYLVPKTASVIGYSDGTANADIYVATGDDTTPKYDKYGYDTSFGIYIFDAEVTGADATTIKGNIDGGTYTATTVTAESRESRNIKTEYINLTGTSAGWEKIGDTEIDLSNYVQFSDLVSITSEELAAMWGD